MNVQPDPPVVEMMVELACRAPSVHNSQPWKWSYADGYVDLHTDRTRLLSTIDPTGRQLTISCGAALDHLEKAATTFKWATEVELLPQPQFARPSCARALRARRASSVTRVRPLDRYQPSAFGPQTVRDAVGQPNRHAANARGGRALRHPFDGRFAGGKADPGCRVEAQCRCQEVRRDLSGRNAVVGRSCFRLGGNPLELARASHGIVECRTGTAVPGTARGGHQYVVDRRRVCRRAVEYEL